MKLYKISILYLHLLCSPISFFFFLFSPLCSFFIFLLCKITTYHSFFSYIQPCSRDNVEESKWSAVSQQGEDEELKCSTGDSQFPAGGRRRLWMCGGEQDGKEHCARTTVFPRYNYFTHSTFTVYLLHMVLTVFCYNNDQDFAIKYCIQNFTKNPIIFCLDTTIPLHCGIIM